MKIVRIIARLNVGGPARHVAWLTAAALRAGLDSLLVAGTVPPGEDDMTYFARAEGVEPLIIPEMSREISPQDAVTVWKLWRLFVRERPDIVHTHTAKAGTVGRAAGWLYRWATPTALWGRPRACRFVHTYHGHIFHSYYGRWKTRLFLAVERWLARVATDRIVVISPQQYREIHEQFRVGCAAQFRIIPLGLDTNVFTDWQTRRTGARAAFGASDADVLVGIVGRLTEIKNHELFLEAVARFVEQSAAERKMSDTPRVRFLIIGDGHLRASLEERARALGLGGIVHFTGTRNDPEDFYAALDVVALTSLNEGTPLTLIEAMACERMVVATSVGGVVDLLGEPSIGEARGEAEGYTVCERGLSVRPRDAAAFSRALVRAVEDADLRRTLGARGRAFVASNYSKERLVEDVLRLYEELSPGRRQEAAAAATGERVARVGSGGSAAGLKGD
ncbi:MAG TPA: glycosyltransferase [Pyrinomonadaceae bacterium]|nr:glycosyltransferase [Pyrinomonadaceae bacterium]